MTTSAAPVLSESATLVTSGIETVSPGAASYWHAVPDGAGILWAIGPGRLVRYDLVMGTTSSWTVDDDLRFAANDITASHAGGVWLIGPHTLRRFDGSRFRAAMDVGAYIAAATEAPDGSLWVAMADGAVLHLAGSTQTRIDALRPSSEAFITAIAVSETGGVWCGWRHGGDSWGWVTLYDGLAWRVIDARAAAPLGAGVRTIAASATSVWVVTDTGLARYWNGGWADLTTTPAFHGLVPDAVALGENDALWVAVGGQLGFLYGLAGVWSSLGSVADLPSDNGGPSSIVPVRSGALDASVLVVAGGGIYRWSGSAWLRILPKKLIAGPSGGQVLAISRDEAWAADGESVWHFARGRWSGPSVPLAGGFVRDLVRTPAGTLWATMDSGGPYVLQGSRWTLVGGGFGATALAVDPQGGVWSSGTPSGSSFSWELRSFGFDGRAWRADIRSPTTDLIAWPVNLAIGPDGSAWVGSPGSWGIKPGLVHLVDGRWEAVHPRGPTIEIAITAVAIAHDGAPWVAGADVVRTGTMTGLGRSWVARFDGTRWTVLEPGISAASWLAGLAAAPNGRIWLATDEGLARFDQSTRTTLFRGASFSSVSVAPDGTVWLSGPSGVERLAASMVAH